MSTQVGLKTGCLADHSNTTKFDHMTSLKLTLSFDFGVGFDLRKERGVGRYGCQKGEKQLSLRYGRSLDWVLETLVGT